MQISLVILFFLLFRTKFEGEAKVSEGATCLGPPAPVEESHIQGTISEILIE